MDRKATSVVCYFTWIGWLIAYAVGDREGARFHLNQSLVLKLASIILSTIYGAVGALLGWIPVIGTIVAILIGIVGVVTGIALFVLWIMGVVSAAQDEEKPLPLIGGFQLIK